MPRVLAQVVHYPRPEHLDDLLGAMARVSMAAQGLAGLCEVGAFHDSERRRLVAISMWESPDAAQRGMAALVGALAEVPLDAWERRPSELTMLPEADLPEVAGPATGAAPAAERRQ